MTSSGLAIIVQRLSHVVIILGLHLRKQRCRLGFTILVIWQPGHLGPLDSYEELLETQELLLADGRVLSTLSVFGYLNVVVSLVMLLELCGISELSGVPTPRPAAEDFPKYDGAVRGLERRQAFRPLVVG